ncbi:MAG: hypothetical protein ACOYOK_09420 [Pseudobdellovibrionaceae bacterium]
MMKCPKCHFDQPKDDYCAQCGLHVSTFKVKKPSPFLLTLKSPFFQLSMMALIIAVLAPILYSYFTSSSRYSQQKISSLQLKKVKESSFRKTAEQPDSETDFNENNDEDNTSDPENVSEAVIKTDSIKGDSVAEINKKESMAQLKDSDKQIKKVNVMYIEIDHAELLNYLEEAQAAGQSFQSKDYAVGVVDDLEKKLKSKRLRIILQKEEKWSSTKNILNFRQKINTENSENPLLELQFEAEINSTEKDILKVQFEMQKIYKTVQSNFPANFEINKPGQAFFISGLVPRMWKTEEKPVMDQGLSSILKSDKFLTGRTELLLVLGF